MIKRNHNQKNKSTLSAKQILKLDRAQLHLQVEEKMSRAPKDIEAFLSKETRHILHELQVHQLELEMQNEELRRAQEELDESRARYFDLYDLAPVGYCTISGKGLILEANLTAANLLGVERGLLVKQPITRFILKDDQDIFYQHRKQILEASGPQACELRMVKNDGTAFWTRMEAVAVKDCRLDSGQNADSALLFRIVMSDITVLKQAEDTIHQSQKVESIGRLAGGVAHDFNNMLGVIIGRTEICLARIDSSHPIYTDLNEIRKAAERSANLTRQLLAFARKQTIAPRVFDLNGIIGCMLKMLRDLIGEEINLVWLPGNNLWMVKADPSQIEQILANLCVNSRDAITGTGTISIKTDNIVLNADYCARHPESISGEYVLMTVNDDGCGMNKEVIDRLFEPFFTTKEMGKGTGLGLSMVYGSVKQNNGYIDVISEPGHGTTFKIYLPRNKAVADQIRKEGAVESIRGHETILLAEDEPAILEMAMLMLQHLGYTVLPAPTPMEAIRLAEIHSADIHMLMTDVVMPGMNGRDLAKKLHSIYPHLKFLFMSGYTSDVIALHGKLDEFVNFIQKPFSTKDLAAKVREALDS